MKTIVGIRPTGSLHIGHYFSVIKPALEEKAHVLIARYHAPEATRNDVKYLRRQLLKFGINPKLQMVDDKLFFTLLNAARDGELRRMIQYKTSKVKTAHLFVYPVLMAHDLVGYDRVIVGQDQKQHVEYANLLFKRVGLPAIEGDYRAGRIMSLTDPRKKMSKSEPQGCLFLDDSPEEIRRKIRKAPSTATGFANLVTIWQMLGGSELPNMLAMEEMKDKLSDVLINELSQ